MMRTSFSAVLGLYAAAAAMTPASAAVVISNAPTRDVTCGAGTCTATAQDARLKISDLEAMLASSPVSIVAGEPAQDIVLQGPLTWAGGTALALDATGNVQIAARLTVGPAQGLAITTHDGAAGAAPTGSFSVANGGRVRFEDLLSPLTINGQPYTLVANATALGIAAAAAPGGSFALADNYNSGATEGTFPASPVAVPFAGHFEGLGNTIAYLGINPFTSGQYPTTVGLFSIVSAGATVENLILHNARIRGPEFSPTGAVAGMSAGTLSGLVVDGEVKNPKDSRAGGLVGESSGAIFRCSASATVIANKQATVGGLVGELDAGGTIDQSFATGTIQNGTGGKFGGLEGPGGTGGLVGFDAGAVTNSYSTGLILVPPGYFYTVAGGLVGFAAASITTSYTTVTFQNIGSPVFFNRLVDAFAGDSYPTRAIPEFTCSACYWDTTTTDVTTSIFGKNIPEIVGLTSAQLAASLPAGFDPTIWTETAGINNGLPYLIANPPR